jgi:hypothetical protein
LTNRFFFCSDSGFKRKKNGGARHSTNSRHFETIEKQRVVCEEKIDGGILLGGLARQLLLFVKIGASSSGAVDFVLPKACNQSAKRKRAERKGSESCNRKKKTKKKKKKKKNH